MFKLLYFLLISLSVCSFHKVNQLKTSGQGTLDITLSNIRNTDGYIYIFIYSYENQYPYSPYKHYKVKKQNVKNGYLTARISNLQLKNEYAISLIDDENNNEDLDRWLGIPREGYGFSNNIRPFLSLPNYNDLIFDFSKSIQLSLKLQYVI